MAGPNRENYIQAKAEEYSALNRLSVFSEPLDTKMVLRRKQAETAGDERRFKARLCLKGFKQIFGVDYFNTFSPVATYDAIRIFLILMAAMDYKIDVVDITIAFLLAVLKEEIYIKIPDGYPNASKLNQNGKVLRLLKSLYGLKQAPYEWNKDLDTYLRSIGFQPCESEKCIYVGRFGSTGNTTVYLLVYVDDFLISCKDRKTMAKVRVLINQKFPLKDKWAAFILSKHALQEGSPKEVHNHSPATED